MAGMVRISTLRAAAVAGLAAAAVLGGPAAAARSAEPAGPVGRVGPVETTEAAAATALAEQATKPGRAGSLSADGQVVTFAENRGHPYNYPPMYVIFARDRAGGGTRQVSRGTTAAAAAVPGNGVAEASAVSGDGRYVAFAQWTDVPRYEVLRHDLTTGTSQRVSLGTGGAAPNDDSTQPAISADGRYVAFRSEATNLVAGDTNGQPDVFVRDLAAGSTRRVSAPAGGGQPNGASSRPAISADGRYVAYLSDATNLITGDTNAVTDAFVRDLRYGITTRVSRSSAGAQADSATYSVTISADGRVVAFDSAAANLVAGDGNGRADVFVRTLADGTTRRVSRATGGGDPNGFASSPALSATGRYVVFTSDATDLVGGDTNGVVDVFLRDLTNGVNYRVSRGTTGAQGNGHATGGYVSADGRYVAFTSAATNLVAGDTNGVDDVFIRDRVSQTSTRANVDTG